MLIKSGGSYMAECRDKFFNQRKKSQFIFSREEVSRIYNRVIDGVNHVEKDCKCQHSGCAMGTTINIFQK